MVGLLEDAGLLAHPVVQGRRRPHRAPGAGRGEPGRLRVSVGAPRAAGGAAGAARPRDGAAGAGGVRAAIGAGARDRGPRLRGGRAWRWRWPRRASRAAAGRVRGRRCRRAPAARSACSAKGRRGWWWRWRPSRQREFEALMARVGACRGDGSGRRAASGCGSRMGAITVVDVGRGPHRRTRGGAALSDVAERWPIDDKFHDECGLFGIWNHPEAANVTYLGLYALQHRGQESAGIAATDGSAFHVEKAMGWVADVFSPERLRAPARPSRHRPRALLDRGQLQSPQRAADHRDHRARARSPSPTTAT